jgi:peptidoglycan/LPS O-acetylase OafA/YrhL
MGYSRPFILKESAPINSAERESGSSDKLLGLELLRFASAVAVLVFHYRHFAYVPGAPVIHTSAYPLYGLLWPLYEYGLYGVQIFWGISGYIFFWKYGAAIRSGTVTARNFFWLRFSRLYPLHILTLLSVVGLQPIYRQLAGTDFIYSATDPGLFFRQLVLATDWGTQSPFSYNGPIWSISAEVAVYAVFFVLLRRLSPSIALCAGVIATGLVAQLAGLNWVSIGCATYFFAGGLPALAPDQWRRPAGMVLVTLVAGCAAAGILGDSGKLPTILLVGVPCLLILASRCFALNRWQKPLQAAGNLTYSSYLLHFPLQLMAAIIAVTSGLELPLTDLSFLIAYVVGTLAISAISYRAFEVPAQRWLRQRMLRDSATV